MGNYRILLTSDIHCTDLETWYGVSDEARLQHWLEEVLAEHARHPFDLILINGDISLDYHAEKTPFEKGYSTSYLFMKMFASRLPAGVPVLVTAGNHEQFPEEAWQKITGNSRQCHAVLGNHTFIMLDGFREALKTTYDSTDEYSPMDVAYIKALMERYPENHVWLISHFFDMDLESGEFKELVAKDHRIKGLFMGHTHEHQLIPLGPEYGNKVIAQTGNFSYTMSGAANGGFWGFRDLVIEDTKATSSYIMAESTVILEGEAVTFGRRVSEVAAYEL
jgi:DNA repair exonuclease SbcCD nuclease subunit